MYCKYRLFENNKTCSFLRCLFTFCLHSILIPFVMDGRSMERKWEVSLMATADVYQNDNYMYMQLYTRYIHTSKPEQNVNS